MKNKAKKIFAMLCFMACAVNASAAEKQFSYLADSSTFTTNYELEAAQSPFANLVVLPYGMVRMDFNEDNADSDRTMFKMCYTVGGAVDEEVQLSEDFKSGAYILYIECGTETDKNAFIVPSANLEEVVSSVNSGSAVSAADFGADNTIFARFKSDINLLIKNARSDTKYTNQSFLDAYMASEGIVRFKNSDLTLDEFADLYDSYYDGAFSTYNTWNDSKKENYRNVLRQHSIGSLSAVELAKDSVFVSECRLTSDAYALQDLVVDYFKENEMDLEKYNSLNSYNKYKVFAEMFEKITTLGTVENIYDKFATECENVKSDTKPSGGGGGGGGGSGIASSVPVITTPDKLTSNEPNANESNSETSAFSDTQNHWAEEYILKCYKSGLINGFDDNTFRPDKTLTRAELTTLLTNLLGLNSVTELSFNDVERNAWYYDSVSKSYNAGIVNGYGDTFKPESDVSRQDMAVMILRGFNYLEAELTGEKLFDDAESVSDYASESIAVLGANGIITGDNNCFRPKDSLTRAEAATIICRVYDYITGGGL